MIIGIEAAHANRPQRTGVENYCWQIMQNLKKQIPSSVRVVLYSNTPLNGELGILPENWQVKILKWPFRKLWSQIRLSLELFFNPPDVFFAPAQLIPLFSRAKKTVVTVHDSAFLVFPKAYNFLGRQYLKWMNKIIVKKAELILTPSEFSKNELKRFYKIDENKIRVIPLGYNADIFKPTSEKDSSRVLEKFKITRPYIISVGRLEEKKNTLGIVKAFNILKQDNTSLKLVLVGTPRVGFEKIKVEIESSPYKSDIILTGWVDDQEIPALLSAASVFVFPSLYEGFGLPVLDAMACGCPVVASKGNSLEEVGGDSGVIYVQPNDYKEIARGISLFLNQQAFKESAKKAGLERVKNYSWEYTARTTWEAINSLSNTR